MGYKKLKVFQMAYDLSLEVHKLTEKFPKIEQFSLTDQIRRSSRSVAVNIGCAYRRRKYPKHFSSKITDSNEEATETQIWLLYAKDLGYINEEERFALDQKYDEVGNMLGHMAENPEKFKPRS